MRSPLSFGVVAWRPVVLERGDALGVCWRARYDGLRLNTHRAFSHLPGMRLPRDAGRYAMREAFIAYLDRYARDNDLEVRLGVDAERIERDRDHGWTVVCPDGPVACPNVVVATGWDAAPPTCPSGPPSRCSPAG